MADLLQSFRDHLIANGIARKPSVAGSAPPMWLERKQGVPAPGEGDNATEIGATLVLGAFMATGIPPRPYEGFIRTDGVQLILRADNASRLRPLEEAIRELVNDRRDFILGSGLWIESMYLFRDMSIIDRDPEQGCTASLEYQATTWGPPLAPPTG